MKRQEIINWINEAKCRADQHGEIRFDAYKNLVEQLDYEDEDDFLWDLIFNIDKDEDPDHYQITRQKIIDKILNENSGKESVDELKLNDMKEKYIVFYSGEDFDTWLPMEDMETGAPLISSSLESAHDQFNEFVGGMFDEGEIDPDEKYKMHIFKLQTSKEFTVDVPRPRVLFSL